MKVCHQEGERGAMRGSQIQVMGVLGQLLLLPAIPLCLALINPTKIEND